MALTDIERRKARRQKRFCFVCVFRETEIDQF